METKERVVIYMAVEHPGKERKGEEDPNEICSYKAG